MRTQTQDPIITPLAAHPAIRNLAERIDAGGELAIDGVIGSTTSLITAAATANAATPRPTIIVTAHLDDADDTAEEWESLGRRVVRLPALEVLPGETAVSAELFAERLEAVRRITDPAERDALNHGGVIVTSVQALMQAVPAPDQLNQFTRTLTVGDQTDMEALTRWLADQGYARQDSIEEQGDFAVRGGILDILPKEGSAFVTTTDAGAEPQPLGPRGVRIDFFGDDIDSITEIDLDTMGSDRKLHAVRLTTADENTTKDAGSEGVPFLTLVPEHSTAVIADTLEATEQARGYYERIVDDTGVHSPREVFKTLRNQFHAFIEFSSGSGVGQTPGVEHIDIPVAPLPEFPRDVSEAIQTLADQSNTASITVVANKDAEAERCRELIREFAPDAEQRITVTTGYVHRGFTFGDPDSRFLLVPYDELLHRFRTRRRVRRLSAAGQGSSAGRETFLELTVGDTVVHVDHGIARFTGLKRMAHKGRKKTATQEAEDRLAQHAQGGKSKRKQKSEDAEQRAAEEEFLTLEFARGAKLHVPASQVDKVQKYVGSGRASGAGSGRSTPPLSTLGGKRWQQQKDSVKESVKDLAAELLRVQAARESTAGTRFPADTKWQKEFEAEFPYNETEDQLAAIASIKRDMTEDKPMDRLLCGDVGFGKTELAIRAAFKAAEFGKQVAVLVPTTVLADQHERTFRERTADYPFTVESVSRFKSKAEANDILKRTRQGQVDILIGTHRLLSKDVKFADLGLVIVDEEQRFGVEHKNKLLELRVTADVLTLSATPIPRTLHLSMLGLRDISSLSTPPTDRRAVVTEVIPYNERRIKAAIERELGRGGQVFFLHNRVHNIQSVADDVQKLAPDARVIIGHGQMPERELEHVMREFIARRADILVSTTIIESGIDIPTANTMFINDAQRFGLAELHQLRGRVGRSKHRGYCYLLLPAGKPVPEVARKRLRAIEEFSMLGAGFKISMRDLEIRGAGNILGAEQSGHIASVGYDMYCRLLDQASRELRGEPAVIASETSVELGVHGSLPKRYIPSDTRRLDAYRRIATARTPEEVDAVETDIRAAYGEPPKPAERLLELARIRTAAAALSIRSITLKEHDVVYRTRDLNRLEQALEGAPGQLRPLSPAAKSKNKTDTAELYHRLDETYVEPNTLIPLIRRRLVQATTN